MRLIDVDELKELLGIADKCDNCSDKMRSYCNENPSFALTCELICNAPTVDAVRVVRCKDCANREHDNYCRVVGRWVYDKEFFCAGRKKRRASIPLPDPIPTDLT